MDSKRTQAPWREGALIPRTVNGTPMYEITIFTAEHIPAAIFTLRSTDPERVKANTQFIVKACNLHDELIRLLNRLSRFAENNSWKTYSDPLHSLQKTIKELRLELGLDDQGNDGDGGQYLSYNQGLEALARLEASD